MNKPRILILLIAFLFACRKEQSNTPLPKINSIPITVTIDEDHKGSIIPLEFEGLSYETSILAESPEILNANNKQLIQLIKNLGPGLLRIGGDSSDEVFWTGRARNASSGVDSLTTSDIDRLAGFSRAIGWPVLFGLNMGKNDPATASNEAQYVYGKLGDNLYALQSGNEPDVYHMFGLRNTDYKTVDYRVEFENYKNTIRTGVPQASFAGPGVAYNTDWITEFAERENLNIKLLDAHYYVAGPASDPGINYKTILLNSFKLNGLLQVIQSESEQYHLPYRLTECNSIYGGGKAGVSDIFASALWALDFMWNAASHNAQGINFHGGNHLIYSPVTIENGVITARPVYYAMLAFKFAGPGSTNIPANIDATGYNCSSYASINSDGKRVITLINKEDSKDFYFTIQTKKAVSSVQVARLKAPAITSTDDVTFGGSSVNDDGTFASQITENYTAKGKTFAVNVPAGSAAVITMQ